MEKVPSQIITWKQRLQISEEMQNFKGPMKRKQTLRWKKSCKRKQSSGPLRIRKTPNLMRSNLKNKSQPDLARKNYKDNWKKKKKRLTVSPRRKLRMDGARRSEFL